MRQRKDRGYDWNMEPFYLEWVPRNDEHIEVMMGRAVEIQGNLKRSFPPIREFDGVARTDKGALSYPCGYCPWLDTCNKDSGRSR